MFKKLIKTGFFDVFAVGALAKIAGFLLNIFIVRIVSKSDYGIYTYANNLYSFFAIFTSGGMLSAILQLYGEKLNKQEDKQRIYKYGSVFSVSFNILLSAIILLTALLIPLNIEESNKYLILLSFMPIASIWESLLSIYFRANLLNKEYARLNIFYIIYHIFFAILLTYYFSINGLITANIISHIFSFLTIVLIYKIPLWKLSNINFPEKSKRIKMIKFAVISCVNTATGKLLLLIDIFVLGIILEDKLLLASYKVSTTIPIALLFIPDCLMIYLYPYFVKNNKNKIWFDKHYKMTLKYFGLFNIFISIILILFAPFIIKLVYGSNYLDATICFRILVLSYIFSATFRKLNGNLLVTIYKLKFNLYIGLYEGILNIILNITLIIYYGSIGAALSTLIVSMSSAVISSMYMRKSISELPL